MLKLKFSRALIAAAFALALAGPASAQSLTVNTTTISLVRAVSSSNATSVYNSVRSNPKVVQLLAKASAEVGVPVSANPGLGFNTEYTVRYSRGGVNSDLAVRTTFVPLTTPVMRPVTTVLMLSSYVSSPQLVVPRLLVRRNAREWHAVEFAYRKDGRIWEMAATHGDCLFRSSLRVVEQKNGPAHSSLRSVLNSTAQTGRHLFDGLRAIYDVRGLPVGQGELLLTTGIFTANNFEEEYDAGYVSGTLDQNFKPDRRDNPIVAAIKQLAKDAMKELLEELRGALIKGLKALFGFGAG